jgi:hypothetical protein
MPNGHTEERLCNDRHDMINRDMRDLREDQRRQWGEINDLRESVAALRVQVLAICAIGAPVGGLATNLILKLVGV